MFVVNFRTLDRFVSRFAALAFCLFIAAPVSLRAAEASPALTEYQVKALFLLNFTRYVDWPDNAFETEEAPFTIGVVGRDPFDDNLLRVVEGRRVKGRKIVVMNVSTHFEIAACQILFVSLSEQDRIGEVLGDVGSRPILTVGENSGFLQLGGAIEFLSRGGNIRLKINLQAAHASDLRMSSQLLQVAESVLE